MENGWLGGSLHTGTAILRPEIPTIRCSMPARAQPGLAADPDVVRTVRRTAEGCLGIYAEVERGGRLAVGDEVTFVPAAAPTPLRAAADRLRGAGRRGVVRASGALMPKGR